MWIRSAFWTGAARPGAEARFREGIDAMILALANLPHVRGARALWPQRMEDRPPPIACQVLVEFANRNDVDRMLASPERLALRGRVSELADLFEGTLSHIDYEVGSGVL